MDNACASLKIREKGRRYWHVESQLLERNSRFGMKPISFGLLSMAGRVEPLALMQR